MADSTPPSPDSSSSSKRSAAARAVRWGGGLLGGLAVLVLVAALVLPRLFTSEQLKGYVIPPLENATGRTVEIDAIGLRVLPFPAVRVTGFRLANDERFGDEPAVTAQALNVDVALWPLFVAKIRPKAIELVEPTIRYEVAEDGTTNFDTLGGEEDAAEEDGAPLAGIPVSNFRATDAQVNYVDHGTDTSVQLDFDTQLSARPDGNAISSAGTVALHSVRAVLPDVRADTLAIQDATLDYDLRAALRDGRVDVRTLDLDTAPIALTASGVLTDLRTRPALELSVETGATDLSQIAAFAPAAAVEGLNPSGTLQLKATVQGPLPTDTTGLGEMQIDGAGRVQGLGLDYDGRALLRDANADLALSQDSVSLRSIQGTLLDASVAGMLAVRRPLDTPQLNLRLETGPMALSTLAAFAPDDAVQGYNPQGTIQLDATATGALPTDADGLTALEFGGRGELDEFGADYDGAALLRDLSAALSFSNATVTADEIDGTLLDESVEGTVTVRNPLGTPQLEATVAGAADLGRLAALAGDESGVRGRATYDLRLSGPLDAPDALRPTGTLRLTDARVPSESLREPLVVPTATVDLTGTGLSADRFTLRSGDQTMALQATVRDLFPVSEGLAETNPALTADFTLTADRLDLVALQPESEDETDAIAYSTLVAAHLAGRNVNGQDPEAVARARYEDIDLPAYAVDGRVEVGTLLNEPQRYDDLRFDLQLRDRRLNVRNLTAGLYGGQLTGSLTLDQSASGTAQGPDGSAPLMSTTAAGAVQNQPVDSDLSYNFQLEDAAAADLLDDWTTLGRLVTGTLDFSIDGDSPLDESFLPRADALSAAGQSLVVNGGLSTDARLVKALNTMAGIDVPSLTDLDQLGGPFTIRNGAFQVEEWEFQGQRMRGSLGGAFGFDGGLDLTLEADLPLPALRRGTLMEGEERGDGALSGVLDGLLGQDESGNKTIPVRLRIGGSTEEPTVNLLNRDAVRSSLRDLARDAGLLNRMRDLFNPDER